MAPVGLAVAGALSQASPPAVGDRVTLEVRALASGGAGVADLPDGRVVFVHRTAPGDQVEADITRLRPRWGTARLHRIVSPGPHRVQPACPHYDACGGCTLQHLDPSEQRTWKGRFVADALERIGGLRTTPAPVTPSPREAGYRNRVTFTLRRLARGRVVAGFHELHRPTRIVDVYGDCLLPEPALMDAWSALRRSWGEGARALPGGGELRLTLRAVAEGGAVLVVKGGHPGWDAAPLLAAVPALVAAWHQPSGAAEARLVAGGPTHEWWMDERIPVGGHAFLQVNRDAAALLTEHVLAQVGTPESAVDAYCGVGVYGRALAREGAGVTGIEMDPHACAAARDTAPPGFQVVEGTVEEHLPHALPAELVLLNPPRTGLHEAVPTALLRNPPARLVYVSCDPATLARDAARLAGAYALVDIRPFDLFPQTSHVESVAVFDLRPDADGEC